MRAYCCGGVLCVCGARWCGKEEAGTCKGRGLGKAISSGTGVTRRARLVRGRGQEGKEGEARKGAARVDVVRRLTEGQEERRGKDDGAEEGARARRARAWVVFVGVDALDAEEGRLGVGKAQAKGYSRAKPQARQAKGRFVTNEA